MMNCAYLKCCQRIYGRSTDQARIAAGISEGRIVVCVKEPGIEEQHLFISMPGVLAMIAALAAAVRELMMS